MKIVINVCYGGFGLSDKAVEYYLNLKGIEFEMRPSKIPFYEGEHDYYIDGNSDEIFLDFDIERDDEALVKTVEDLGDDADGKFASLKIVEIPDGTEWQIEEYDGMEHVAETHKTWG